MWIVNLSATGFMPKNNVTTNIVNFMEVYCLLPYDLIGSLRLLIVYSSAVPRKSLDRSELFFARALVFVDYAREKFHLVPCGSPTLSLTDRVYKMHRSAFLVPIAIGVVLAAPPPHSATSINVTNLLPLILVPPR